MEFLREMNLIHSGIGLFHTIVATLAMIFGTIVLLRPKGTKRHRQLGYLYVVNMALMIISSFGIYNFGGFSLFHGFSIVSTLSIVAGIYPAIKRSDGWHRKHYYFMSWSVVGLYCAFWAETGVRFFDMQYFWWVVMLATMVTAGIGGWIINRQKAKFNIG